MELFIQHLRQKMTKTITMGIIETFRPDFHLRYKIRHFPSFVQIFVQNAKQKIMKNVQNERKAKEGEEGRNGRSGILLQPKKNNKAIQKNIENDLLWAKFHRNSMINV